MKINVPNLCASRTITENKAVIAHTAYMEAHRKGDKAHCCRHEAGHFVVSAHFNLDHYCCIVDMGDIGHGVHSFCGENRFFKIETSAFKSACIGWAGIIADRTTSSSLPAWRERVRQLWDTLDIGGIEVLSLTDADAVNRHPQRRRTFKTAFRILEKEFRNLLFVASELDRAGEYMASHARKKNPTYLPVSGAILDGQFKRLSMMATDHPGIAAFALRLAQMLPTKSPAERERLYREFLLFHIRAIRAKTYMPANEERARKITSENLAINKRDGLAANEFYGWPDWHASHIARSRQPRK